MSSIASSIQTIIFCSVAILASTIFLWCLSKIYAFVAFPIVRAIKRAWEKTNPEEDHDNPQPALPAISIGGFLCYGLITYKTTSQHDFPEYSVPDQRMYEVAMWIGKIVLSACVESVAVLAILSGVIKVMGLDGGKAAAVELGKDEGRMA